MNNKYTLKKLADIGAKAANSCLPDYVSMCVLNRAPPHHVVAREAFTKAILDAIGYKFPKDEEREAFDAWCNANHKLATTDQFEAWKAGREELLKTQALAKEPDTKTEPAWIPWNGGDKSPIVGRRTKYQVQYRDGVKSICVQKTLSAQCWSHSGTYSDIIAYRILKP
jgi:hypothetical protein